ncbi:BrnT family toxin [Afipia massiliensis]|uniref:BrnT family toxin n=1 Tax=Afipia massiliensis TaxID=211460 RepID=A0A4U6BNA4_9BRAD|nr:BrnT family toxin [Afipia massiliensis]TKT71869.1 BrnT family toxin [Afipia massiliensis]
MADNGPELTFIAASSFEWDDDKNHRNIEKHGIDFDDAVEVFDGPILLYRSDRNLEERWVAIGKSNDHVIAVIFTRRNDIIRIISARSARKNEKESYRHTSIGRPAKGKD